MDITSERNVQGWTLQLRGMYRDIDYKCEECTGDRHYMLVGSTGTDTTSERNVQGRALQMRGMYRHGHCK